MRPINWLFTAAATAVLWLAAPLPAPLEAATWQHHRAGIGYFSITSI
jgi:hypothetical protein